MSIYVPTSQLNTCRQLIAHLRGAINLTDQPDETDIHFITQDRIQSSLNQSNLKDQNLDDFVGAGAWFYQHENHYSIHPSQKATLLFFIASEEDIKAELTRNIKEKEKKSILDTTQLLLCLKKSIEDFKKDVPLYRADLTPWRPAPYCQVPNGSNLMQIRHFQMDFLRNQIHLYGRHLNGKSSCVTVKDLFCSAYIVQPGDQFFRSSVKSTEVANRHLLFNYQKEPPVSYKVTFERFGHRKKFVQEHPQYDFANSEATLIQEHCADLNFGDWIEFSQETNLQNLKPVTTNVPKMSPIRYMVFDIENLFRQGAPVALVPVIQISCVTVDVTPENKCNLETGDPDDLVDSVVIGLGSFESQDSRYRVIQCNSEKNLLDCFMDHIRRHDPDVLVGHNFENFDLDYIHQRLQIHYSQSLDISRHSDNPCEPNYFQGFKTFSCWGRSIYDTMHLARSLPLETNSLNSLAAYYLGNIQKVDIPYSQIRKYFREDPSYLGYYCFFDSYLLVQILSRSNKIINMSEQCAMLGPVNLEDAGRQNRTTSNLTTALMKYNQKSNFQYIFPNERFRIKLQKQLGTHIERKTKGGKAYEGGYVQDPIVGYHENVATLDAKSLYPSIIRAYNICPTTITNVKIDDQCIQSEINPNIYYYQGRSGLLQSFEADLWSWRDETKQQLKKLEPESFEAKLLDGKQAAIKLLMNSIYGILGTKEYSRFSYIFIANEITKIGQRTIKMASKIFKELRPDGEVIYGDTDSIFTKLQVNCDDEYTPILDAINSRLPKPMEIQFEKRGNILLKSKKLYIFQNYNSEKPIFKGIATRRMVPFFRSTFKDIFTLLINKKESEALNLIEERIKALISGNVSLDTLVRSITVNQPKNARNGHGDLPMIESDNEDSEIGDEEDAVNLESTGTAQFELYRRMLERHDPDTPALGDRISFLLCIKPLAKIRSKKVLPLKDRIETPEYIAQNPDVVIDYPEYVATLKQNFKEALGKLYGSNAPPILEVFDRLQTNHRKRVLPRLSESSPMHQFVQKKIKV